MNRCFVLALAVACLLSGLTVASAAVQVAEVASPQVACVPQPLAVQSVPVVSQVAVQATAVCVPQVQTVAVQQQYAVQVREKRPGLVNRIRAFRNAPRRRVASLEPVAAAAVPVSQAYYQPSTPCVGVQQE